MKPNLIDTWGIEANADDTNDYTTSNPEPELEPFSLWDVTPAEIMAAVFYTLILYVLACIVLPFGNYGGHP
jgi:hypothetical protein